MGNIPEFHAEEPPINIDFSTQTNQPEYTLNHMFLMALTGVISALVGFCIAAALIAGVIHFTSQDANLSLTRDQVIQLASHNDNCREFLDFYNQNAQISITSGQQIADEKYGGLHQITTYDISTLSGNYSWNVIVYTRFFETPLLKGIYFGRSQKVVCTREE